jgi:O-antigen ligase
VRSIFRRRIALALLACALVALILAGFAPGKLFASRVLRTESALESASVRERVEDVSLAWTLIRAQPLIGVGPGYYEAALWAAVGNSQPPGFPGFRVVHNLPLLVLAELGMIGFLLWLAWVLGPVVQRIQWPADRMWDPTAAGVSAAWVGLLAIGLFDGYMHVPASWWSAAHLGLLAGAWGRLQAEAAIAGAARDAS